MPNIAKYGGDSMGDVRVGYHCEHFSKEDLEKLKEDVGESLCMVDMRFEGTLELMQLEERSFITYNGPFNISMIIHSQLEYLLWKKSKPQNVPVFFHKGSTFEEHDVNRLMFYIFQLKNGIKATRDVLRSLRGTKIFARKELGDLRQRLDHLLHVRP